MPKSILIPELTKKDKARFWSKVNKGSPDECWEWNAGRDKGGYGVFWIRGKCFLSHRISWSLKNGQISPEKLILHECDNPPCENPSHLFAGSQKENMQDASKKTRMASGARNGRSKITEIDVLEIRRLCSEGATQTSVSKIFRLSQHNVSRIVHRKIWRHI